MLRAHVTVIQSLGLFASQSKNLFYPWGVGDVAGRLGLRSKADLFVHGLPDRIQIETHFLQNVDGNTLAKVDQSEKQMFGPHVVVMESIRFLPCQGKDLLGTRGEVTHWLGHNNCIACKTPKVNLPKVMDRFVEPGEILSSEVRHARNRENRLQPAFRRKVGRDRVVLR